MMHKLAQWILILLLIHSIFCQLQDTCIEHSTHIFRFQYDTTIFTDRYSTLWDYAFNRTTSRTTIMAKGPGPSAPIVYNTSFKDRVEEMCVDPENCDGYNAGLILKYVTMDDRGIYFFTVDQINASAFSDDIALNVIDFEGENQIMNILNETMICTINVNDFKITQLNDIQSAIHQLSSPFNLTLDMSGAGCIPYPDLTVTITRMSGTEILNCNMTICTFSDIDITNVQSIVVDVLGESLAIYHDQLMSSPMSVQTTPIVSSNTTVNPTGESRRTLYIIIGASVGGAILILVIIVIVVVVHRKRKLTKESKPYDQRTGTAGMTPNNPELNTIDDINPYGLSARDESGTLTHLESYEYKNKASHSRVDKGNIGDMTGYINSNGMTDHDETRGVTQFNPDDVYSQVNKGKDSKERNREYNTNVDGNGGIDGPYANVTLSDESVPQPQLKQGGTEGLTYADLDHIASAGRKMAQPKKPPRPTIIGDDSRTAYSEIDMKHTREMAQ